MNSDVEKKVRQWLDGPYDEESKQQIQQLLKNDVKSLNDAFYTDLHFGTAGLRGIMGVGTNRMNVYTVRKATQGLAHYLLKTSPGKKSVFVSYDSRHHSDTFAKDTACVLAANGIQVYLTRAIRPTPFVSFGCRYKKCNAAVMITASHNPPEYNGYKVYWKDGGQVVPPHDEGIIKEVEAIQSLDQVKLSEFPHPLIEMVDESLDRAYVEAIHPLRLHPEEDAKHGLSLKIGYTSLHGTGITLAPLALKDWGFTNLSFVEKQIIPDGDFPTAKFPNPEFKEALQLGIEHLLKTQSDLLIATDPDADRMGIVCLHKGKAEILTGNEIAAICVSHICQTLSAKNRMPKNAAFVTTIVSSDLLPAIVQSFGASCCEVLTGFKYIAEKIRLWEGDGSYQFLFGAEESYGYLFGTVARDKDAIVSACLISECALSAKMQNLTLVDILHQIYRKYGIFREKQLAMTYPGQEGLQKIKTFMANLRKQLPEMIAGKQIVSIEDYESSVKHSLQPEKKETLTLPKSDVLLFRLEDGGKIVIRPSGTEPKIKIYAGVKLAQFDSIQQGISACESRLDTLLAAVKKML